MLAITLPTLAAFVGTLVNNRQFDSFKNEMRALRADMKGEDGILRAEIGALKAEMNARFQAAQEGLLRVEGVFDARLNHLEEQKL